MTVRPGRRVVFVGSHEVPPVRVLLVTHDASLTGAPMVALLVARQLVDRDMEVQVISRRKGPLLADFRSVAPTRREFLAGVRRRLWLVNGLGALAWLVDVMAATLTLARHRPDLVHLNTSASAVYVHAARRLGIPVLLHVHESADNTERFLAEARVRDLAGVGLVACSPSVHAHLVARTGRRPEDVFLLPSVPDDQRVRERAAASTRLAVATEGEAVRRVGAVGTVGARKGTDLWLRVAEIVQSAPGTPRTAFVWVGHHAGLTPGAHPPGVEFTGPLDNPYPVIARLDLLTLPSRDDPFPLVVLEGMLLGVPVVAFDVGSVRDQVGDGGVIVPAGDVDAFAAAVQHLLVDDEARATTGARARLRAERLYSTTAFGDRLQVIIEEGSGSTGQPPRIASRQER